MSVASNSRQVKYGRTNGQSLALFFLMVSMSIALHANVRTPLDFTIANIILCGICAFYTAYGRPKKFGLYSIFYIFHYILFGLVPPLELSFGLVYWAGTSGVLEMYLPAMALSVGLMIVFDLVYRSAYYVKRNPGQSPAALRVYGARVPIIVSVLAAIAIYWDNGFSLASVFARGGDFVNRSSMDQSTRLLFQYSIYPLPAIALVFYMNKCHHQKFYTVILMLLFILANPITGMPRFQAASLYMAVSISFFPGVLRNKLFLTAMLIISLLFVFPLLDLFRNATETLRLEWSLDFIYAGHFDAFQSLARVMELDLVTWGYQLIGAILFFVPRAIWPTKPIGSGHFVAGETGLGFSNISMTFIAEGYINFGIVGSLAFVALAGWVFGKLDAGVHLSPVEISSTHRVFYLFALGLAFLMMRGDLMSSFAYTIGLLTSVWALTKLSDWASFHSRLSARFR